MPNPNVIDLELKLLKRKWSDVEKEDRPTSLAKAIKHYDNLKFPNFFTLIKIGRTLPVTSAECELLQLFRHENIENMVNIYDEIRSPQFIGNNEHW